MTLTGKLSCQRLRRSAVDFYSKKRKKSLFEPPFRALRGNVRTPSMARLGWVTMSADFRGKGASPTNHCWCEKTRVIALSCGIKISAVHHLVLSQYTRLADGQNCDSNTVRCITCSCTVIIYSRTKIEKEQVLFVANKFKKTTTIAKFRIKTNQPAD